jgi:medium-chain acyl-[acyl-carrier-protein] hydrolase
METKWFKSSKHVIADSTVRLFCFPYAGGSAHIFNDWQSKLGVKIDVMAAHLPGRGVRLREPSYKQLDLMVAELETAITPLLDRPYAFFGHSMGGLIAFELSRRLHLAQGQGPSHLFISGRSAPQRMSRDEPVHKLADAELIKRLSKFNGTPQDVLDDPELLSLVLPFLRADFEVVETYTYCEGVRLNTPVTILGGNEDHEAPEKDLLAWQEVVNGPFKLHMFPGDHFFIRSNTEQVLSIVKKTLIPETPLLFV